jgi:hypothetical protein
VIVAHGASQALRLRVPGAELEGVVDATTFLGGAKAALGPGGDPEGFRASLGLASKMATAGERPSTVLVLGAGNTAMDVARSARRLGLSALCIDWLDERFALARPDELDEARVEGVEVRFSTTLARLGGDRRVARAELASTVQKRAERPPEVRAGHREVIDVDLVVMAMGYRTDPAFAQVLAGTPVRRQAEGLADRRWTASGILAGPASSFAHHRPVGPLALGRERALWTAALPLQDRLWAVGDALVGPSTVVEAMAQGRRAGAAILAARPARPGRPRRGGPRRILVCYESRGGRTAAAAEAIATGLLEEGHYVRVLPIAKVGLAELAGAEALVVGTWVEGLVVAKVGPAEAMATWLADLPRLGGKPVAIFCTFAVAPKRTLPSMRRLFEEKGTVVVAQAAFGRGQFTGDHSSSFTPATFAKELARRLEAPRAPATLPTG